MRKPKALKNGARIGVCAPSSRIGQPNFDNGVAVLKSEGFDVFVHPQTYKEFGQIAGSAEERTAALQDLLLDTSIDAVIFSCGGHRAGELIPLLDWQKLKRIQPKILMGFSDICMLLHAFQARLDWVTFFGPMVQHIGRTKDVHPQSWANSKALLQSGTPDHRIDYHGPVIEGRLLPVTLSLLTLLLDSKDLAKLKGAILCIEDVNEELSAVDRMLLNLKRRGVFEHIAALAVGEFTGMKDSETRPFGFTLKEIVKHHAGECPVAFDVPIGHGDRLYALPVGVKAHLEQGALSLLEPCVI